MKNIIALTITLITFLIMTNVYASKSDCPVELSKHNLCANISWKLGPQYGIYSKAVVTYWKKGLKAEGLVDPNPSLEVYPWMIMHGMEHGSRPVVINRLSNGSYRVSKILFTKMNHGFWEMRFKINQTIEQNFDPKADYDLKFKVKFTGPTSHRHHH